MLFKRNITRTKKNDEHDLTTEELEYAKDQYEKRVAEFCDKFSKDISNIDGPSLAVYSNKDMPHLQCHAVEKSIHSKIIDTLRHWSDDVENFPYRITKVWKSKDDACSECKDMSDIAIDVTSLFIGNDTDEVYKKQQGALHDGCKCAVMYEIELKNK